MTKKRIFELANGVSEDYLMIDQDEAENAAELKKPRVLPIPTMQVVIRSTDGGLVQERTLERSGTLSYLKKELQRIDQAYSDCYRYISLTASGTTYTDDDARYHLYFNLI